MKWFFAIVTVFGLFVFTLYVTTNKRNNHSYRQDEVTGEYVSVFYEEDTFYTSRFTKICNLFIDCCGKSFNTLATFNIDETTLLGRFFSYPVVNIIMLPLNFVLNLYNFFISASNLFVDIPLTGGGGGGFHGGR